MFQYTSPAPSHTAEASKLGTGYVFSLATLTGEPKRGMLKLVDHVQRSVPNLVTASQELHEVEAPLERCAIDLEDFKGAIGQVVDPGAREKLDTLAKELRALADLVNNNNKPRGPG